MRRWFLSRFYHLGFGGWFGPRSIYADSEGTGTEVMGDEVIKIASQDDAILSSEAVGDPILAVQVAP